MKHIALVLAILVSACASLDVDRAATGFDARAYAADLDACRGGRNGMAALETIRVVVEGSLVGTYYGLWAGAAAGDDVEGMAIGALVGAVVGLGTGGSNALDKRDAAVRNCVAAKGYTVLAVQTVPELEPESPKTVPVLP